MSVEGSVRERRRAETVREIKGAALQQLAEGGTGALSLRGVARAVGHDRCSRSTTTSTAGTRCSPSWSWTPTTGWPTPCRRPPRTPGAARRCSAPAGRHRGLPGLGAGQPPGVPAALRHAGARRSRRRPTPAPARPPSGWPPRSWRWCSTAGPPSSWPRCRCPAARAIDVPDPKIPLPPGALAYFIELRAAGCTAWSCWSCSGTCTPSTRRPASCSPRPHAPDVRRPWTPCSAPARPAARVRSREPGPECRRASTARGQQSGEWRARRAVGRRASGAAAAPAGRAPRGRRGPAGARRTRRAARRRRSRARRGAGRPPARRAARGSPGRPSAAAAARRTARSASAVRPARSARRTAPKSVSTVGVEPVRAGSAARRRRSAARSRRISPRTVVGLPSSP